MRHHCQFMNVKMNLGDCYQLLELTFGATLAEVKASYRRLARQYHPDLNPCASAHDRFIQLQQAYETLRQVAPVAIAPIYRSYVTHSPTHSPTPPSPYPGSVTPRGYRSPADNPAHSSAPPTNPYYSPSHNPHHPHHGAATPPDFRAATRRSSQASSPTANPSDSGVGKNGTTPGTTRGATSGATRGATPGVTPGATHGVPHEAPRNTHHVKAAHHSKSGSASEPLSPLDRQLKRRTYQRLQQLLKQHRFPHAIALVEGLAQRLPQDVEVRQWKAVTYQCFGRYCTAIEQYGKAQVYLTKAYRTDPHNRELLATLTQDLRYLDLRRRQSRRSKLS